MLCRCASLHFAIPRSKHLQVFMYFDVVNIFVSLRNENFTKSPEHAELSDQEAGKVRR